MNNPTIDTLVSLCKRRGFVFPGSEIYGGLANTWDYGPLGVELRKNIKTAWWQYFVQRRHDMMGLDAAILMNPKVWEASGHVAGFHDPLVDCKNCKQRFRADHLSEEHGVTDYKQFDFSVLPCPSCGQKMLTPPRQFNMMFKTFIGPVEESAVPVYLRPETAQGIFVNYKNVQQSSRAKLPFGIGQIGKSFRNEITPGNFIFRLLELEQMEIEYFIRPENWEELFQLWLDEMHAWGVSIGLDPVRMHDHEIPDDERAHYSKRSVDIEFDFPFGQKELWGLAYRTDFDLKNHQEQSGEDLTYFDQVTNERFLPHVIEPALGVDRTLLAVLTSAYHEEEVTTGSGATETRVILKLVPALAPFKVAILPLSRKPELEAIAMKLYDDLASRWSVDYDVTQSIGKRYRRQDEIGTPYCITVDFDSVEDEAVTVRERDSMKQERVPIKDLRNYLQDQFQGIYFL